MSRRWLFKEEPTHYSFAEFVRDGATRWNGVANNLALRNLREARPGDLFFYYHTGDEKAVVGIGRVTSAPYPDPDADDPRLVALDVVPVAALARPVSLAEIKREPELADFELVRLPRLSVMPVSEQQWAHIEGMARRAPTTATGGRKGRVRD
ncbi:MAG: EVE domain-containing protein [Acidobacteria bacterium]|nr:EVE domain-containing protein [Acidobacteriota bacterium]